MLFVQRHSALNNGLGIRHPSNIPNLISSMCNIYNPPKDISDVFHFFSRHSDASSYLIIDDMFDQTKKYVIFIKTMVLLSNIDIC